MSDAAHKSADAAHASAEAAHKSAEAATAAAEAANVAAEATEAKPSRGILKRLWGALTWPAMAVVNWTRNRVKKITEELFDIKFDDDPSLGLSQAHGKAENETLAEEKPAKKEHEPKAEAHAKPTEAKESHETVSELSLEVADHCNNPKGHYIGLSEKQREKLGVKIDDEVTLEITDSHGKKESKTFKVGMGKKELVDKADQFTANDIPKGSKVVVKKKAAVAHAEPAKKAELPHGAPVNDAKPTADAAHGTAEHKEAA